MSLRNPCFVFGGINRVYMSETKTYSEHGSNLAGFLSCRLDHVNDFGKSQV